MHLLLDEYGATLQKETLNMFRFWFGQYFILKTSEYETYLYNRKKIMFQIVTFFGCKGCDQLQSLE